jgi:gustatory receptor
VAVDSLFFGICLNICAFFDILLEMSDRMELRNFVENHRQVLDMAARLNYLVKPIIFVQFLVSSLILCIIGFQLVMFQSFYKRLVALLFGTAVIIQLFIYSFGGQQIMDKSINVSGKMYNLNKNYRMIIMRSHRPCKIQAGIFKASLPSFLAILSNAGSLMMLLKSLVE